MKKMAYVLCLCAALFLMMSGCGPTESERTINENNEYGGKTNEHVFFASNAQYKQGIEKTIFYRDSNSNLVRTESYFTDAYARENGVEKTIAYRDSNGNPIKTESYFTDAYASKNGITKTITYRDSNGKPIRTAVYDRNGALIR